MALDRRNYRQLVDTTVEIANRVGAAEIIGRVVDDLKVLFIFIIYNSVTVK
jgi:splicing factor 3B subunit 1